MTYCVVRKGSGSTVAEFPTRNEAERHAATLRQAGWSVDVEKE